MSAVPVDKVEPGALVDVYVNNLARGYAAAGGTSVTVPISGRLKVGDGVRARQRLCGQVTALSEPTGVNRSTAKDWPIYHHDAQHSGRVACSDINSSNIATLKPAYPAALTLDGDIISVPAVVGGKIYIGTSKPVSIGDNVQGGGILYRIDLASGTIEQTFSFVTPPNKGSNQGESGVGCTPAVIGGKVFFSALDGNIRCLDANTFSVQWTTNLRAPDPAHNQPVSNPVAETWSSPLAVNNRVYVGAGEGESGAYGFVYCLDADSGKVIWLFCTNQFVNNVDNQPNVVPGSTVGGTIPPGYVGFTVGPEPLSKGSSVWSSCAYHAGLNRVYVGTGNPDPDSPLPNTPYGSGIVSLDASTGDFKGFFQPLQSDSYRPDDSDLDFPCPPTVYSIPGQDVVTIAGKNGASFLLDPSNFDVLARRQLLPKDGAGNPLPSVDPHAGPGENLWGVFASAAVDPTWGHIYYGLGGYAGVDASTTPFMRACDWATLDDEWPTAVGADTVTRYSTAHPPMYMTSEAGLSSPVIVNDVVLVATSAPTQAPALYGFSSANGVPVWMVPGFAKSGYCLGPAVYGDYVVAGAGDQLVVYTL